MNKATNRNPYGFPEPLQGEPAPDWIARLREDQLLRWKQDLAVPVAGYLEAFPQLTATPDELLDLIAHEAQLRREAGEVPTAAEYAQAFPDLAEELERQFALDASLADLEATGDFHQLESPSPGQPPEVRDNSPLTPGPPPDPPPGAPRVPSRFWILRRLGDGGFGEVWLARDLVMIRDVALKFPKLDPGQPELLARFRREAEMAARVNHPNLCTLYECFWDHDPPFLVLEYVDGMTLTEVMTGQQPFPLDQAVDFIADAAAGVLHAHRRQVVHRDLKPDNIKVRIDRIVKVLDFGLARPYISPLDRITSDRNIVGTLQYMAPEQLRGQPEAVGPAADQYALGVILYQMITGQHPFLIENATDTGSLIRRIDSGRFPPPCQLRSDIDEGLNSIVLRMMQRNPADRFASLDEAINALTAYRQGNRVPVPLPRPKRRAVPAAVVGVLILVLAVFALWPRDPKAHDTPEPKPPGVQPAGQPSEGLPGLLELIRRDLDQIDVDEQPYQRYFSLAHLRHHPDASPELLQKHRDALIELLPALHFGADSGIPQPIDAERLVFRLNLRQVGWADDEHWKALHRGNPYALQFPPDNTERMLRNLAVDVNRKIGAMDSRLPAFLRVDWFVVTFTDPERARTLLALSPATPEQIGERLRQIEKLRQRTVEVVNLYARPVDLPAACRELGTRDSEAVRQAILASPLLADELGLRPLTEGKSVERSVWAWTDVPRTTFGELAMQLKLGRRKLVD